MYLAGGEGDREKAERVEMDTGKKRKERKKFLKEQQPFRLKENRKKGKSFLI